MARVRRARWTKMGDVLGHVGVKVPDLGHAATYDAELMPLLDYETFLVAEDEVAFMPAAGRRGAYVFFYEATDPGHDEPTRTGLQHLAFIVPTRSAVRSVHAHVERVGGTVLRAPRGWPQYPPPYFGTFWLDRFGIMLEAVCHHDRD